jgi:hypothetical protein
LGWSLKGQLCKVFLFHSVLSSYRIKKALEYA